MKLSAGPLLQLDEPWAEDKEDLLGRSNYAKNIAHTLKANAGASMIVGITGKWGEGKTWFCEAVLSELNASETNVVRFSPWLYRSFDGLVFDLLDSLARGAFTNKGERAKRLKLMYRYALLISGTLGTAAAFVAPGLRPLRGALDKVLNSAVRAHDSDDPVSIQDLHSQLSRGFASANVNPTLVVVDDIDRLAADEIRLVFKVIRANASFPNVTWLVLFDEDVVVNALSREGVDGLTYLEKIVPLRFPLPPVPEVGIRNYVESAILRVLSLYGPKAKIPGRACARLAHQGLIARIPTIRLAQRIVSDFATHVAAMTERGVLCACALDLFVLSILRQQYPVFFRWIGQHADLLGDGAYIAALRRGQDPNNAEEQRNRMLIEAVGEETARETELLRDWLLNGSIGDPDEHAEASDSERAFYEYRFRSSAHMRRYLGLDGNLEDVLPVDVEELLEKLGRESAGVANSDCDFAASALRAADWLEFRVETIGEDAARNLGRVLLSRECQDRLSARTWDIFPEEGTVASVVHACLSRVPRITDRLDLVREAIATGSTMVLAVMLSHAARSGQPMGDVFGAAADALRKETGQAILAKFRTAPVFWLRVSPSEFFRMREWVSEDEARTFVAENLYDFNFLLELLWACSGQSSPVSALGEQNARQAQHVEPVLRHFLSLQELDHCMAHNDQTLSAEEVSLLEMARQVLYEGS